MKRKIKTLISVLLIFCFIFSISAYSVVDDTVETGTAFAADEKQETPAEKENGRKQGSGLSR